MQAASLVLLFTSLAFRLSERSEGSGEQDPESFRQQLTSFLSAPQPAPFREVL